VCIWREGRKGRKKKKRRRRKEKKKSLSLLYARLAKMKNVSKLQLASNGKNIVNGFNAFYIARRLVNVGAFPHCQNYMCAT
jgi:hypothetical protein